MKLSALQNNNAEVINILYGVAEKLEHAKGVDEKELDEIIRVAFQTFLQIEKVMGISSISNTESQSLINEIHYMAYRIGTFQPEILANRRQITPLLHTLTEISDRLPG